MTEPNEKGFSDNSRPKTCSWRDPTSAWVSAITVLHDVMIAGDKNVRDGELTAPKDSQRAPNRHTGYISRLQTSPWVLRLYLLHHGKEIQGVQGQDSGTGYTRKGQPLKKCSSIEKGP